MKIIAAIITVTFLCTSCASTYQTTGSEKQSPTVNCENMKKTTQASENKQTASERDCQPAIKAKSKSNTTGAIIQGMVSLALILALLAAI